MYLCLFLCLYVYMSVYLSFCISVSVCKFACETRVFDKYITFSPFLAKFNNDRTCILNAYLHYFYLSLPPSMYVLITVDFIKHYRSIKRVDFSRSFVKTELPNKNIYIMPFSIII